jgi:hypothetical protein
MDDFRVGSVPPYDPVTGHQRVDDSAGRKKKKPHDQTGTEEDTVTLSEHEAGEEESGAGYGPRREEP